MGTVAANSVVCPRCGYDLRGQVDAWHPGFGSRSGEVQSSDETHSAVRDEDVGAKCPVEGTCSECGLTFEWADLFSPARQITQLLEVDERVSWRTVAWTLWYSLWCWPLWKRLGMHHPIRLERIAAVVVASFVVAYVGIAPVDFCITNADWFFSSLTGSQRWAWRSNYIDWHPLIPFGSVLLGEWWNVLVGVPWFCVAALQWLLMPFCFFLLPISLRRAKVRKLHLVRGVSYATTWMVLSLQLHGFVGWIVDVIQNRYGFSIFIGTIGMYEVPWMASLYSLVGTAIWWSVFSQRYLKLRSPWLVGSLLALLCMLLSVIVVGILAGPAALAEQTV